MDCCKNCTYYMKGECHKLPPAINWSIHYMNGEYHKLSPGKNTGMHGWPFVQEDDWCGEHRQLPLDLRRGKKNNKNE